eukprot:CAMPEP_0184504486 /NCGR_PEP_ID=MMETSP0113_2-20130426/52492_1 /TAXON_ID=91329 /ORGANISM="Norrisiella sphaerica, Strain BC52" /LENGTH=49 /DNA_ID=CAMNT_0026894135 /DNA_START=1226 /DNA_END=1375 /DNA_ORIENTATION=+
MKSTFDVSMFKDFSGPLKESLMSSSLTYLPVLLPRSLTLFLTWSSSAYM